MPPLAQCAHCPETIRRNGTRWVHQATGRKACAPGSVHQAQPRARSHSNPYNPTLEV